MTEPEKAKKLLSAQHDIDTLQSLLDHKKPLSKAESTIYQIMETPDYATFIAASRIKYNLPGGNCPFGNLSYVQQRNAVFMLKDAINAYQTDLATKKTKNEK